MIAVLSGGTGGAKFLQGLARVIPQEELTVVVNTSDDAEIWGLHVSPDIDSVVYGLAGLLSQERGWGLDGETFHCLDAARRLGLPAWFQLGDRDLATHIARTQLLRAGRTLRDATAEIAQRLGVRAGLLPMSNDRIETRVRVAQAELSFQEYFVRELYQPEPLTVRFAGVENATPAEGVLETIATAEAIIIAPSNPITSIGPILAVPGIREALRAATAPICAVSPIVSGQAVSGPAAKLMRCAGYEVSAAGVARCYSDFLKILIADKIDQKFTLTGPAEVHFCDTIMVSTESKERLAREVLRTLRRYEGVRNCESAELRN